GRVAPPLAGADADEAGAAVVDVHALLPGREVARGEAVHHADLRVVPARRVLSAGHRAHRIAVRDADAGAAWDGDRLAVGRVVGGDAVVPPAVGRALAEQHAGLRPPVAPAPRRALLVAVAGVVRVERRGRLRDAARLAGGRVDDGAALAVPAARGLEEVAHGRRGGELEVRVAAACRRGDEHRHPNHPPKPPHRSPDHRFFAGAFVVFAPVAVRFAVPAAFAALFAGALVALVLAAAARFGAGSGAASAAAALVALRAALAEE